MKRLFTILVAVLLTASLWAQSPEAISYQAVVRDAGNNLISNQAVGMQIGILQGSEDGALVYSETQNTTSNANGLVSIKIGDGTVVEGDLATIDWANGPFFIKTETDPTGGTDYTIVGVSQLLSVPYALHAKTAETVENVTVDYGDVSNTPDLSNFDQNASDDFDGDYNNLTNTPDLSGYLTSEVDGDATNEIQTISRNALTVTLTDGGTFTDSVLTETEVDNYVANNGYAADADLHTVAKSGSYADLDNTPDLTVYATKDMGSEKITNMADPTEAQDAATKAYVDAKAPAGTQTGQMQYWDGMAWVTINPGAEGFQLQMCSGVPTWMPVLDDGEVYNPLTGKIWMDRNLGASQVATSSTDAAAYGDLYQWGRAADGHESRTSVTIATLTTGDNPGHGNFITIGRSPYDWRNPQNDDLWQGVSGTNNPCPSGYRLPTEAEWEAERTSWSSNNAGGAFASPLKLPMAGSRFLSDGTPSNVGSYGYYWSSAVDGTNARSLYFNSSGANMNSYYRASGFSVRCLKD